MILWEETETGSEAYENSALYVQLLCNSKIIPNKDVIKKPTIKMATKQADEVLASNAQVRSLRDGHNDLNKINLCQCSKNKFSRWF